MKKRSAGILLYRYNDDELEFLLAHPGGPFYKKRDLGVWSIPKGELNDDEDPKDAAIREFKEELGAEISGTMLELTPVRQSAKIVLAWAVESDFNIDNIVCNTFAIEWPPKSGVFQDFPEIDRVEWFNKTIAKQKIITGQISLIDEITLILTNKSSTKLLIDEKNKASEP